METFSKIVFDVAVYCQRQEGEVSKALRLSHQMSVRKHVILSHGELELLARLLPPVVRLCKTNTVSRSSVTIVFVGGVL